MSILVSSSPLAACFFLFFTYCLLPLLSVPVPSEKFSRLPPLVPTLPTPFSPIQFTSPIVGPQTFIIVPTSFGFLPNAIFLFFFQSFACELPAFRDRRQMKNLSNAPPHAPRGKPFPCVDGFGFSSPWYSATLRLPRVYPSPNPTHGLFASSHMFLAPSSLVSQASIL